jgi:hypothetical protein
MMKTIATIALVALLGSAAAFAAPARPDAPVFVNNLAYDAARHSLVLDITGPVTISSRALKNPPRLVVDIPTASLKSANRELVVRDQLIQRVRVSQWRIIPPVVRVVIETAPSPAEPLIAVQQTADKLYITLAPARANEDVGGSPLPASSPQTFTPPPHPATPRPAGTKPPAAKPTPRLKPTRAPVIRWQKPRAIDEPVAPTPTPGLKVQPRPTATPTPRLAPTPRPRPTARPKPTPRPHGKPTPITHTRLTPLPRPPVKPTAAPVTPRPVPSLATPTPMPTWRAPESGSETESLPRVP